MLRSVDDRLHSGRTLKLSSLTCSKEMLKLERRWPLPSRHAAESSFGGWPPGDVSTPSIVADTTSGPGSFIA